MATTNYSWTLPTVGGSEDTWGDENNTLWTDLDTLLGGVNATEFAILDGATVTTAELNILDGVTATTAEINIMDGVTATTTEINYSSGVTSAIQTQLDGKQASDATLTALAGTLTAANKIPYATASDTAGELDLLDEDDMSSDSATGVPTQQSVKAYVDSEVSGFLKVDTSSALTLATNSNYTFTPTLSTIVSAEAYLVCTSAVDGFAIGDEVQVGGWTDHENNRGLTVYISGSDVKSATAGGFRILNPNNGSMSSADIIANFDLRLRAYGLA